MHGTLCLRTLTVFVDVVDAVAVFQETEVEVDWTVCCRVKEVI